MRASYERTQICDQYRKTKQDGTVSMKCSSGTLELREYLSKSDFAEDPLLVDTIPSSRENADIVTLSHNLAKFKSIQLALQKEETTLAETRALFDSLINEYPVMAKYISQNSAIVHSKDFESAIVKIQDEKYDCMNFSEKQATVFLKPSDDSEVEQIEGEEDSFAEAILKKRKFEKACKSKPILYKDTAFPVPTSNILERFFQCSKIRVQRPSAATITCKPGSTAFSEVEESILG